MVLLRAHLAFGRFHTRVDRVTTDRLPSLSATALGGAVGAVARFQIWQVRDSSRWLMASTFAVNVVGCLLLGAALGYLSGSRAPVLRAGVLGLACGFTTFGFYALHGVTYDAAWHSVLYIVTTPVLSVVALAVGALITRPVAARR